MMTMFKMIVAGGALFIAGSLPAQENLFLAHADGNGVPEGRKAPAESRITVRDGKLNVALNKPGSLEYVVYMTPDLGTRLHLSGRMRATALVPGKEGWQNGRIALRFLDRTHKLTGGWPRSVEISGTSAEKPFSRVYSIPPGAVRLLIEPANFGKSGSVEFRDLQLTVAPENLLLAPNPNGIPEQGITQGTFRAKPENDRLNVRIDGTGNRIFHVPLEPSWKSLKLEMKMKTDDVQRGDADWKNARITLRFYNGSKAVGPWPEMFHMSGTNGWRDCSRIYEIPAGAKGLNFEPANFGISGSVEFRDMKLSVHEYR